MTSDGGGAGKRTAASRRSARDRGLTGESDAAAWLESQGYRILERNYRCPYGEVDLVAEDADVLVFVEVKTRASFGFGMPVDSITPAKRRKIARAAGCYLMERVETDCAFRVDVVEVALVNGRVADIRLLRSAFSLEDVMESLG